MAQAADPGATRHLILSSALTALGASAGVLFELADGPNQVYEPSCLSPGFVPPDSSRRVTAGSLLVRWLRVNDSLLPVPDRIGVFETLAESERSALRDWRISCCLPLVSNRELVGWVGCCGHLPATERTTHLPVRTAAWALSLSQARTTWQSLVRAEAVARSNRLSVTGQVAASVAHEVRNPLAAIRSTVQILRDHDVPASEHAGLLQAVLDEVDRVNHVLTGLLTLGKPHHREDVDCDLWSIAEDAAAFCGGYTKRHGQRIVLEGRGPAWVSGDPRELRQVFVNVLLNACQASQPGTEIRLEAAPSDDGDRTWTIVRVVDRGAGVRAIDLARVFEPFYSTKTDGGGLGLSICRDIVERHGGRISMTSQVGTGTTVTICLPRRFT